MNFTVTETIGQRKNFLPWHRKPWSTMEHPSFDSGRGTTTGGAYNTSFKMGELNAPVINSDTGLLSDPEFTTKTGLVILPGTPESQTLINNLADNQIPLSPSGLFAK